MSKEKYLKELKIFINKASKDFKIDKVIFFGSLALGKGNKNSDIDLIIVSDDFKGMNFFERGAKMYDCWDLRLPVDFLCYTKQEFETLRKRISIVSNVLEEGIVI